MSSDGSATINLARTVTALRVHELTTTNADVLAWWITKAHEALRWYATADFGPDCRATAAVRAKATDALKGVE